MGSFEFRGLGYCCSVLARVRGAEVYAGGEVAADGLATAYLLREAAEKFDLMAALREAGADDTGKAVFHHDVATGERVFREPGRFQRGLNVHAEVGDIRDELRVGLRLGESTHDSGGDAVLAA